MQMRKMTQRGFTLIELMIVVAIIGILAAVAFPMLWEASGKAKKVEAIVQLDKFKKRAIEEYNANSTFPQVNAITTPGTSCCQQNFEQKKKCAPDPTVWDTPEWKALEFSMVTEPFLFQYGYSFTSAGAGFEATATGDTNCNGVTVTYTLNGSIPNTAGGTPGAPKIQLIPPQNAD